MQPAIPVLEDVERTVEDWQVAIRAHQEWERRQRRARRMALSVIMGGLLLLYAYGVDSAAGARAAAGAADFAHAVARNRSLIRNR